jgi:hypothetical protein
MNSKDDLTASLTNIRVLQSWTPIVERDFVRTLFASPTMNLDISQSPVIELNFALTNQTNKPLYIAERWNSWGAWQWYFRIVDVTGKTFVLGNPVRRWGRNFLSTAAIMPGENHITNCHVAMLLTNNWSQDYGTDYFSERGTHIEILPSGKTRPAERTWVYPIQITGIFATSRSFEVPQRFHPELIGKSLTWKGETHTETWSVSQNGVVKPLTKTR